MDRPVTIKQGLIAFLTLVLMLGGILYAAGTRDGKAVGLNEVVQTQLTMMQGEITEIKADAKEQQKTNNDNMNKIQSQLTDILVQLKGKKDR